MRSVEQDKTELRSSFPPFTPKFQEKFEKFDPEIRRIFLDLVGRFLTYRIKHYTRKDKYSYVMSKKYVFCGIAPLTNCFEITLRDDTHHLSSNIFKFEEKDKSRPAWRSFQVNNENEIEEAFRLINEVYKYSA